MEDLKFILLIVAVIAGLPLLLWLVKRKPNQAPVAQADVDDTPHPLAGRKAPIAWGESDVVGYNHLPSEAKQLLEQEMKTGAPLQLRAEPVNPHDAEAIRVLFQGTPIGFVPRDFYRKRELFYALQNGKQVHVECKTCRLQAGRNNAALATARFEMDKQQ